MRLNMETFQLSQKPLPVFEHPKMAATSEIVEKTAKNEFRTLNVGLRDGSDISWIVTTTSRLSSDAQVPILVERLERSFSFPKPLSAKYVPCPADVDLKVIENLEVRLAGKNITLGKPLPSEEEVVEAVADVVHPPVNDTRQPRKKPMMFSSLVFSEDELRPLRKFKPLKDNVKFYRNMIMLKSTYWDLYDQKRRHRRDRMKAAFAEQKEWKNAEIEYENAYELEAAKPEISAMMVSKDVYLLTVPDDNETVYTLPLEKHVIDTVLQSYMDKSPYFTRFLTDLKSSDVEFYDKVNRQLQRAQFRRGTIAYYVDWLFGTRRARDEFQDSLKEPAIYAEAGIETSEVTKTENVTLNNERETVQDEGYLTTQRPVTGQLLSMQESTWTMQSVMNKPVLIKNVQWSVGQATGTYLWTGRLPGDFIKGPHATVASLMEYFRMLEIDVEFQINGNKFLWGNALAVFVPIAGLVNPASSTPDFWTIDNLLAFPHVMLSASTSNSGRLRIPFFHMYSYFNTVVEDPEHYLGDIHLIVFNKLGATTAASQQIDIAVWVSYPNCELHQPVQSHPVKFPTAASSLPQAEAGIEGAVKAVTETMPGLARTAGRVMGFATNCDKPTDPTEISRWVPNTLTSLNFGDGLDKSNRLSLQRGTATITDPLQVSTTKDDADLSLVMRIPTRVGEPYTWTTQQGPGSFVFLIPMYPTLYYAREDGTDGTHYSTTLLGYITRGFKYYRGPMNVDIEVLVSTMNSGRLQISYIPGQLTEEPTFEVANYCNPVIMDIQEKHSVNFSIPYMSSRPWMRCDRLVDRDLGYTEVSEDDKTSVMGWLVCHVLNRLTSPDSANQTVEINVRMSAGEGFEVAFPTDFSYCRGTTIYAEMEAQDDVVEREPSSSMTVAKAGPSRLAPAFSSMGESCMDLKTLLRRYTKCFEHTGTVNTGYAYISWINSPTAFNTNRVYSGTSSFKYRTTLCHFTELYVGWRGTLRYKAVMLDTTTSGSFYTVFHVPAVYAQSLIFAEMNEMGKLPMGALEAVGTIVASGRIQGSTEFEVPFYTCYSFLRTVRDPTGNWHARNATGTVFITITNPNKNIDINIRVYQSAGDDFSLTYLRGPPGIVFTKGYEDNRSAQENAKWLYPRMPPTGSATDEKEDDKKIYAEMFSAVKSALSLPEESSKTMKAVQETCATVTRAINATGLTSSEDTETDGVDSGSNPIQLALNVLAEYLKDLPGALGPLKSITQWTVSIANIVSGFNSFLQADSLLVKACAIVTVVSELLGSALDRVKSRLLTLATSILEMINGNKQGNELPEAEILFFDFVPVLMATLGVGAVALGWKSIPTDKEAGVLIKGINEKLRLFNSTSLAITNLKNLWNYIKEITDSLIDWMLNQFAPQILAQMKLEQGFEDIEKWAKDIDDNYGIGFVDQSNWDPEYRVRMLRLADQADRLRGLLITGKIGREASVVREYCRKALEMRERIIEGKYSLPSRRDPFSVCFVGEPGVGKSTCVFDVATELMDEMGYPLHKRICSVNPCEQFFTEAYDHHSAVYIDDIAAFTSEEQYKNFFNLKSNTAFPLNMASLEKKGMHFSSDFIFSTSNVPWPTPNCLLTPMALWRRRDALIKMEWATAENREFREDYSHAVFTFLEPRRPNVSIAGLRRLTFQQMKDELHRQNEEYMRVQDRVVANLLIKQGYRPPPGVEIPQRLNFEDRMEIAALQEFIEEDEEHFDDADDELPQAELGVAPRPALGREVDGYELDLEKVALHPELSLYVDSTFWEHLNWHPEQTSYHGGVYDLNAEADDDARRDWATMINELTVRGFYVDDLLVVCSKRSNIPTGKLEVLKGKLTDFKNYLQGLWQQACEKYDWLNILKTWPVKLAAALVAVGAVGFVATKVVKKCKCALVRHFGYRCGSCGKWPEFAACKDKAWLLEEWKELYGATTEYEDFRVTTLEEEQAFDDVSGCAQRTHIHRGTRNKREVEAGPYSQDVKGMKAMKVFASGGPYANDVKGQKTAKIFAENAQRTEDLVDNRLIPGTYRIRNRDATYAINGLAIGGRMLMIPNHFFDVVTDEFEVFHGGCWMRIKIHQEDMHILENKDLVIYNMPKQFHLHRSLAKHFISENDLNKLQETSGYLVRQTSGCQVVILQLNKIRAITKLEYINKVNNEVKRIQKAWKYSAERAPGACGSPLISTSTKISGQILGVHVSGGSGLGYSTLVTQEMIEKFITTQLGTPIPPVAEGSNWNLEGHFSCIGQVGKSDGVFQSKKTDIIPTEIHGLVRAPVTEPAVLHSSDVRLLRPINVTKKAIEKYGVPPIEFPREDLKMIFESVESDIENWDLQRKPRILTKEEAVLGIPEYEGFDRLPMNTSPGYPYVKTRPVGEIGKRYLFDEDGNITSGELTSKLESRLALAKRGERCVSVWTICMKDERRSLEKVKEGSTRAFSIPPVDLSLVTRMYTLDFSVAIKDNRHVSFTKVGIDVQSLEWTRLYDWLAEFSTLVVAGDFTRFDGTIPPDISFMFYEHIDSFYKRFGEWSPEDRQVRLTLADEGVHTVHISGREIFVNHTGNESGDPNTVNKNSFVNYYYMAAAWLSLAREHAPDKANMAEFRKNVRLAIYGDDNLLAIKGDVIEWYNQISVSEVLLKYGIVYTNESKTGLTKYKTLDEATFLKNSFATHESIRDIKVPLMAENTMYELLNWTRVAPVQSELLEDNCNDALRFAYFYGKTYFENFRGKIISALHQNDLKLNIMTYTDFHYWFLFVIGKLPHLRSAEGFFELVSQSGNGQTARLISKAIEKYPYRLLSNLGVLRSEGGIEKRNNRFAFVIPSGEGKSWLCNKYPELFVDHDEILLPAARKLVREYGISRRIVKELCKMDFPANDERVLLCHHPDNTERTILGIYKTPEPTYIRANAYQRLRIASATVIDRDLRNEEMLRIVKDKCPGLWKRIVVNDSIPLTSGARS